LCRWLRIAADSQNFGWRRVLGGFFACRNPQRSWLVNIFNGGAVQVRWAFTIIDAPWHAADDFAANSRPKYCFRKFFLS
jgi:hypothetical protein